MTDQSTPATKECPDCLAAVNWRARICPNCRAYFDWRRYVNIGQTNLALLVALLSVATTLASVLAPLTKSKGSDIRVVFEKATSSEASFWLRNDGQSSGFLQFRYMLVELKGAGPIATVNVVDKGTWIESDKEKRIEVVFEPSASKKIYDDLDSKRFFEKTETLGGLLNRMRNDLTCRFRFEQSGYYGKKGDYVSAASCDHFAGALWTRIDPL